MSVYNFLYHQTSVDINHDFKGNKSHGEDSENDSPLLANTRGKTNHNDTSDTKSSSHARGTIKPLSEDLSRKLSIPRQSQQKRDVQQDEKTCKDRKSRECNKISPRDQKRTAHDGKSQPSFGASRNPEDRHSSKDNLNTHRTSRENSRMDQNTFDINKAHSSKDKRHSFSTTQNYHGDNKHELLRSRRGATPSPSAPECAHSSHRKLGKGVEKRLAPQERRGSIERVAHVHFTENKMRLNSRHTLVSRKGRPADRRANVKMDSSAESIPKPLKHVRKSSEKTYLSQDMVGRSRESIRRSQRKTNQANIMPPKTSSCRSRDPSLYGSDHNSQTSFNSSSTSKSPVFIHKKRKPSYENFENKRRQHERVANNSPQRPLGSRGAAPSSDWYEDGNTDVDGSILSEDDYIVKEDQIYRSRAPQEESDWPEATSDRDVTSDPGTEDWTNSYGKSENESDYFGSEPDMSQNESDHFRSASESDCYSNGHTNRKNLHCKLAPSNQYSGKPSTSKTEKRQNNSARLTSSHDQTGKAAAHHKSSDIRRSLPEVPYQTQKYSEHVLRSRSREPSDKHSPKRGSDIRNQHSHAESKMRKRDSHTSSARKDSAKSTNNMRRTTRALQNDDSPHSGSRPQTAGSVSGYRSFRTPQGESSREMGSSGSPTHTNVDKSSKNYFIYKTYVETENPFPCKLDGRRLVNKTMEHLGSACGKSRPSTAFISEESGYDSYMSKKPLGLSSIKEKDDGFPLFK